MIVGVFSDVHGNLGALDEALALMATHSVERMIYLGDAVGYIPDVGPVRALLASGMDFIRGNHEAAICSADRNVTSSRIYRYESVWEQLTRDERRQLSNLPTRLEASWNGVRCLFVHGSPIDPTDGYVYPDTDLAFLGDLAFDWVFMGHTHRPFLRPRGNTVFVNVGSVGLPRDDTGMGCLAIVDTKRRLVDLHRFSIARSATQILCTKEIDAAVAALLKRAVHPPEGSQA